MSAERSSLTPAELWGYAIDPEPYRNAGTPMWLDELDLKPAPPYLKMGTRALDLDTWLTPDTHRATEVALRNRLLDEQRAHVFGCTPSADAASAETLAMVVDWLRTNTDVSPDELVVDPNEHPLAAAARLVQEDLCLMIPRDGSWYFDGGVVCFPTLWLLDEKLGRSTTGVHVPVAHYEEELAERVDRFFDRLTVDRPVWPRCRTTVAAQRTPDPSPAARERGHPVHHQGTNHTRWLPACPARPGGRPGSDVSSVGYRATGLQDGRQRPGASLRAVARSGGARRVADLHRTQRCR